jgi:hypothetical protein
VPFANWKKSSHALAERSIRVVSKPVLCARAQFHREMITASVAAKRKNELIDLLLVQIILLYRHKQFDDASVQLGG